MDLVWKRNWNRALFTWTALAVLLIEGGCGGGSPIRFPAKNARDAALQLFQSDARRRSAEIDWDSVRVLQEQPVREDVVFILLSFQEARKNSQQLRCLYYYGAKQSGDGWSVHGSGGGCAAAGQAQPNGAPIEAGLGGGWSRDPDGLTFSVVRGFVFSNRVASVDVTWDDDARQRAEVIGQAYMAVRLETRQAKKVEALDADGNILYTYTP